MEVYLDQTGREHKKPEGIVPQWRISGYALIVSPEAKILMVQPTWNNKWELPGGGIEVDELIGSGIKRECYEETGYEISVSDQPVYLGQKNFYGLEKYFKAVILIYPAKLLNHHQNKEAINSVEKDEISQVSWVERSELNKENTHTIIWPYIEKLI